MISIWKPLISSEHHWISLHGHAPCECRPSGWCLALIFPNKTMSSPTNRIAFSRKEKLYFPFWRTIFVLTTEFAGCCGCTPNPESDLLNLESQIQGHQLTNSHPESQVLSRVQSSGSSGVGSLNFGLVWTWDFEFGILNLGLLTRDAFFVSEVFII